jgi:hypothetical protein
MPPPPQNDPMRIAHLRAQDGRPRLTPPTLQAVLGGDNIQPGREHEAIAIWQSLRARAQSGDVAASEDLSLLTLMIVQQPSMQQQPQLSQALSESTLDAAVLPRHKQEQLGRLCRLAVAAGERQRALALLSMMNPSPPELDADSEFRVSASIIATMDRQPQRVLEFVGPQKDALPIVDSMDPMASVIRANAYEQMGNIPAAAQILRELPDPRMLGLVQGRFPSLGICAQSSQTYTAATMQEAGQRAAARAGGIGCLVGVILAFVGLIELAIGLGIAIFSEAGIASGAANAGIGLVMIVIGIFVVLRARAKGRHAMWLRTHGIPLQARIVNAQQTGTYINNVPQYQFALQVAGPNGPFAASFTKLAPEHEVAMLMGRDVRVRANPNNPSEVILED